MAISASPIPPGEGTPADFQPTLPPKEVVQALREMVGQLVNADAQDAIDGKPVNQKRQRYREAVQHAIHLCNAARFTGEVPAHWHPKGGRQIPLIPPPDATAQKQA